MKRYIYAATSPRPNIFKLDTGTSYYNNFLNSKDLAYMEKSKNRTGHIEYMTPTQYYQECADEVFEVPVSKIMNERKANSDLIAKYTEDMLAGDKFPLCYLNYADSGQEGLHRMMAAGNAFGWDVEFPVLVVNVVDDRIEEFNKIWRYFDDVVYDAQRVTYRRDTWEEEFIQEVESDLEHYTDKHYDVIITSRRDLEECAKYDMDYAIEIVLAEFKDIMQPITIFEPNFKDEDDDDDEDIHIDDDDIDIDDDDIDWDLLATL